MSLAFNPDGSLKTGEISAKQMRLFGAIDLKSFDMKYASGAWSLAVAAKVPGGGGGSAQLTSSGGVISSATLVLTDVSFLGKVTVKNATVSYASQSPNSACNTQVGTEIWCGSWQVVLPQATTVTGVSGSLAFVDGAFAAGNVDVTGNVPLFDGVFLTELGGLVQINPPPTTVAGHAVFTFGPTVNGASLLSLDGTLTREFPNSGTGGKYSADGELTALPGSGHDLVLASGNVTVPDSGATTVALTIGPKNGTGISFTVAGKSVAVTGDLNGTFTATTFTLTGHAQITVPVFGVLSGSIKANNDGMAACATTPVGKAGFEYVWLTGAVQVFDDTGCSERGF